MCESKILEEGMVCTLCKRTCVMGVFMGVMMIGMLSEYEVDLAGMNAYALDMQAQMVENDSIEKYNALLKEWAYDEAKIDDVKADFPDYYGGAYIDDDHKLVIQVTEISDEVRKELSDIISLDNVVFEKVNYPYAVLVSEKEKLIDAWQTDANIDAIDDITAIGVDVADNAVAVYVDSSGKGRIYHEMENDCKELTDFAGIKMVYGCGESEPTAVLLPGDAFGDRSVGFWAKNSAGDVGIVTAPHNSIKAGDAISINGTTFGTAGTPYYGGSLDAVFVRQSGSAFAPSRYVGSHSFNLASGSYISLPVGATVYSRGKKSNEQTGVVEDVNFTCTNSTTNVTLTNVVLATNTCQNGDSGGIVAGGGNSTTRNVAGIITRHRISDNHMIYVKVMEIKSALNITVY